MITPRYPSIGFALMRVGYGVALSLIIVTNLSDWRVLWGSDSPYTYAHMLAEQSDRGSWGALMLWQGADWWVVTFLGLSLLSSTLFAAGLCTRITTITTLLAWWSLVERNTLLADGGDNLAVIALMLCTICPMSERLSVDSMIRRTHPGWMRLPVPTSIRAAVSNAGWLMLCVQTCILYCVAGLSKVQGEVWQDGTAVYYILRTSEFANWPGLSAWTYEHGAVVMVTTQATVLLQVFFPFLIFNKWTKLPTFAAVTGMHIGIGVLMGLPIFSMIMIATELIFIPDSYWRKLRSVGRSREQASTTATVGKQRTVQSVPASLPTFDTVATHDAAGYRPQPVRGGKF